MSEHAVPLSRDDAELVVGTLLGYVSAVDAEYRLEIANRIGAAFGMQEFTDEDLKDTA